MAAVDIPHPGIGLKEFVSMMAALMATNALGVDAMLPALQQIGASLGVADPNARQWIITAYMLGFGMATIVYGTLADRFGRKPVLLVGLVGYVLFNLMAVASKSFEVVLLARALQGVAAAASRVVSVSIVRDCYAGRRMARVMSFTFVVFLGVPILAPSLGQLIMLIGPWRWIFVALAGFGLAVLVWVALRLPETLAARDRTRIGFLNVARSFALVCTDRMSLGYSLATTFIFGGLIGFINSAQQVFTDVFKKPLLFTIIFAIIAAFIAIASLLNARLVDRLGMRVLAHTALLGFIGVAALHGAVAVFGFETIWSFTILQSLLMFCFGLLIGNFSSIAMEALGRVAGTAASAQGFLTTVAGALIGFFIGQMFNGTDVPLCIGFLACGLIALAIVLVAENGKLFSRRAILDDAVHV
jgi:DHA1 family bicyclomycin/chloramphenicol resistance-like MFS transporter